MKTSTLLENISLSSTSQIIKNAKNKGWTDTLSLASGEPKITLPTNCLRAVLEEELLSTKYSPAKGFADLINLIQEKLLKINKIKANTDQITIVSGGCNGILSALMAITNPGDEILIPNPSWEYLPNIISLARSIPKRFKFIFNNGRYEPDWDDLNNQINPQTKALLINSPLNPLGIVLNKKEIEKLIQICSSKGIWLISDEVLESFVFFNREHISPRALSDNTITIHSFSKSFGLTGIRLGYITAPEKIITLIQKFNLYNNMYPPSPSQRIAHHVLQGNYPDFIEQIRNTFEEKMVLFAKKLAGITGVEIWMPEGGLFLFPKFNFSLPTPIHEILINDYHLLCVPGESFGSEGHQHIRLFYGIEGDTLSQAIQRIRSCCEKYASHLGDAS